MSNAFLIVGTFGTPRGETETSCLASSITRPDLIRLRAVEMQTILSKTPGSRPRWVWTNCGMGVKNEILPTTGACTQWPMPSVLCPTAVCPGKLEG